MAELSGCSIIIGHKENFSWRIYMKTIFIGVPGGNKCLHTKFPSEGQEHKFPGPHLCASGS